MPIADMHTKRRHVGVISAYRKLYAIGGHDGVEHLNSVEVYCSMCIKLMNNFLFRRKKIFSCILIKSFFCNIIQIFFNDDTF